MSAVLGVALVTLFVATMYHFLKESHRVTNYTIAEHVKKLAHILNTINHEAQILGFGLDKTPINFLNVKSFSGSEIGSMVLGRPHAWKGPYMKSNPTVQDHLYYVLQGRSGYYITPGDGVRLSNGKVLGKDIVITPETDIALLLKYESALSYQGQPLIVKLDLEPKDHSLVRLQAKVYGAYRAE